MDDSSDVVLEPIRREDTWAVADFLRRHAGSKATTPEWAAAIVPTWSIESPNHGYQLRRAGEIVGVQVAVYSRREIAGTAEDFCNLGVQSVLPAVADQGVRLLRALLDQRGYTFTDLSSTGEILELEAELGFVRVEDDLLLVPNLPLSRPQGTRIISDPDAIGDLLDGVDRRIFEDHRRSLAAIHLVLMGRNDRCYVMVRRERRAGHVNFAQVLHASDAAVLRKRLPDLGRHLLLHHAMPFTVVDLRMVGSVPISASHVRGPRTKLYLSTHLAADSIDHLYSDLALVAW